jgi:hypothetical protein
MTANGREQMALAFGEVQMAPHEDCAAYYLRRAAEERQKAESAPTEIVRLARIELADLLMERALIAERSTHALH